MPTADACYTMCNYNETAPPALIHPAADVTSLARKVRRAVEALDATLVIGHDSEEWPEFKKAAGFCS